MRGGAAATARTRFAKLLYPQPGHEEDPQAAQGNLHHTTGAVRGEYALAQLWMQWGVAPKAMIGHSLVNMLRLAGRGLFAECRVAYPVGARAHDAGFARRSMLAVRLPEAEAYRSWKKLSIAALNSPGMTVVSGSFRCIDALSPCSKKRK